MRKRLTGIYLFLHCIAPLATRMFELNVLFQITRPHHQLAIWNRAPNRSVGAWLWLRLLLPPALGCIYRASLLSPSCKNDPLELFHACPRSSFSNPASGYLPQLEAQSHGCFEPCTVRMESQVLTETTWSCTCPNSLHHHDLPCAAS